MSSQKFKVKKLRDQKPEDLLKDLEKLKGELIQLRTVKVSAGNAQKLGRIGVNNQTINQACYTQQTQIIHQQIILFYIYLIIYFQQTNYKYIYIIYCRKRIAKYLTVINEQRRNSVKNTTKSSTNLPVDLRGKRTRAIRQRLTRSEKAQKTQRQWKRLNNFPLRKFALKE